MLIFRMETATGVGMYANKASTNIINDGTSDRNKWPMPYDDSRFKLNQKHHIEEMYPDNHMLIGSKDFHMFYGRCKDLRKCGLFEFYEEDNYKFGFNSYEQMEKWISDFEWRKQFVEAKIYLTVYDVPRDYAILGYTQCTFRRDKAKLLHSFIATSSEEHIISVLRAKRPLSDSVNAYYKDFLSEDS